MKTKSEQREHAWTTPRNDSRHSENPVASNVSSFSAGFQKDFFSKVTEESKFHWWFTLVMMVAWEVHST